MKDVRLSTILTLILLGVMSRFLPHLPNCTAINSIALFGAYSLGCLRLSMGITFAAMLLSDIYLGLHSNLLFVYTSLTFTILLGYCYRRRHLFWIPLLLATGSILFFVVTNFGVWLLSGYYPYSFAGLTLCYLAGLPFLVNQLLGDLIYGALIFGSFALAEYRYPKLLVGQAMCS